MLGRPNPDPRRDDDRRHKPTHNPPPALEGEDVFGRSRHHAPHLMRSIAKIARAPGQARSTSKAAPVQVRNINEILGGTKLHYFLYNAANRS